MSRILSITVRGFRAYGTEAASFELAEQLTLVHAANSQGKTSLAEAFEFLISGTSSRRDLLGGAKAEYHESLRNAHLPPDDQEVYVEAQVRTADGVTHIVRRELIQDYGAGVECESLLLIDDQPADDLASIGIPLADPPVQAPVLLQHILRHALATEPKQRVAYFKVLLSLIDLDTFRRHVTAVREALEQEPQGRLLESLDRFIETTAASAAAGIQDLTARSASHSELTQQVTARLLEAGEAITQEKSTSIQDLSGTIESKMGAAREKAFPIGDFNTRSPITQYPPVPDTDAYGGALAAANALEAAAAPIINAILASTAYSNLESPVDCPVCGSAHALSPGRLDILRDQLAHTQKLDQAAAELTRTLTNTRHEVSRVAGDARELVPRAASWTDAKYSAARKQLQDLGLATNLADSALTTAKAIGPAATQACTGADALANKIDKAIEAVSAREPVPDFSTAYTRATSAFTELDRATTIAITERRELAQRVDSVFRHRTDTRGLSELGSLLTSVDELVSEIETESSRRAAVNRVKAAERALKAASSQVLDSRFQQMSKAIETWWTTIRPEELVGFGGVKRRATGDRFINLLAQLRTESNATAVERNALGVFSDSQLNALGLSIFLARAELLSTPVLVLDDPVPGSDGEHRLTFVQNTLGKLLDSGLQVILTTYDTKLTELTQSNHSWREMTTYELTLADSLVGSTASQTSDRFSQLMLEAEDHVNSPSARSRRAACGTYRAAAERLAKQIIATGRTNEGIVCSVRDVEADATVLGELVGLLGPYFRDNAEKGQWNSFAKVLNPGNHDDDLPSNNDLKVVRGNLRTICKYHKKHWPGGLLI